MSQTSHMTLYITLLMFSVLDCKVKGFEKMFFGALPTP